MIVLSKPIYIDQKLNPNKSFLTYDININM